MKLKIAVFCGTWLIGACLFAGLVVRQDKNGHIVLTNTLDKVDAKKGSITFLPAARSHAVPLHYKEKIQSLTKKHQLREDLVFAVAKTESGFNPLAVSPKGAVGIMQLMKATARQYGVINRYNASENMEAGVRHLKYLYEKYRGNIPLTLAAYNAGEEAVSKYNGVPPYLETKQYIRRVMSLMGMSSTFSSLSRPKTKIYKYTSPTGRTIITDTLPSHITGTIEIIN
ncbi:MAG: lytic transglycosylase domain-containing protein [Chrysiogenales bacterium]|jgi:soluble lytic murein transglycosylase-like protein|nr:MAG: lytic transglycosylase domain-containing protein [Chrysiogenales bacterium]